MREPTWLWAGAGGGGGGSGFRNKGQGIGMLSSDKVHSFTCKLWFVGHTMGCPAPQSLHPEM